MSEWCRTILICWVMIGIPSGVGFSDRCPVSKPNIIGAVVAGAIFGPLVLMLATSGHCQK